MRLISAGGVATKRVPKAYLGARRLASRVVFGGALSGLFACSAPVVAGVDEHDANEVVSVLAKHGIASEKESDPEGEGHFRVVVGRGDAPTALGLLADSELPRPKPHGLGDLFDGKTLIPTAVHERAQMTAGIAGDLERTLLSVEGVRVARVHLALAEPSSPFAKESRTRATASVLLEHRGAAPPMTPEAIQRLVAGATHGLAPEDVSIIVIARPAPPLGGLSEVASVGPISVSRGSLRALQASLAGAFLLVVLFAGLFVVTYLRLHRERRAEAK